MSTFSNNLRFLREKRGLKLLDFEKFGIKSGTMSNYELGKTEPKMDTIIFFSKFFEVSTDNLLFGDLKRFFEWKNVQNEEKSENFSEKNVHPTCPPNYVHPTADLSTQLVHPRQYDLNDGKTYDFNAISPDDQKEACNNPEIQDLERAVEFQSKLLAAKDDVIRAKDNVIATKDEVIAAKEAQIKVLIGQADQISSLVKLLQKQIGYKGNVAASDVVAGE